MKPLLMLVSLVAVSLGFSSCCSMFGKHTRIAGYRTDTHQVKTGKYDLVTEEVFIKGASNSCKDGLVQTVTKKVPRYKTVTKEVRLSCGPSTHLYCPKKGCGGTTSDATLNMTSSQGSSGSPSIGLVPSMKKVAP